VRRKPLEFKRDLGFFWEPRRSPEEIAGSLTYGTMRRNNAGTFAACAHARPRVVAGGMRTGTASAVFSALLSGTDILYGPRPAFAHDLIPSMDQLVSALPTLLVCAAALFAGGLVKGVTSLGLPIVALPLMMTVVEVPVAVGTLIVPVFLSNMIQAAQGEGTTVLARRFAPLLIALGVGTLLGTMLFALLSRSTLLLTLGPISMLFATASLLQPDLKISPAGERFLAVPIGLLSGVVGGMSTLFGPLLSIYVVGLHLPRDTFVKVLGMLYVLAAAVMLVGTLWQGTVGPTLMATSVLGMIPVWLGMAMGARIRSRIDQKTFRILVLGVIWITGANMIRSGLGY
jgi:uncharacterized membrane protein YfcA